MPGVYAALRERERTNYRSRPDPRLMHRYHGDGWYCTTPGVVCDHEPLPTQVSPLLVALEVGATVRLQGHQLSGHGLPNVRLRGDQAVDWFEVSADDRITQTPPT